MGVRKDRKWELPHDDHSNAPKWIVIGTGILGLVAGAFMAVTKYYEIMKTRAEALSAEKEAESPPPTADLGLIPGKLDPSVPPKLGPITPQPAVVGVSEVRTNLPANVFIGRWKFINEKGIVSSYLTVTSSGAMRDHAPDSPGTWEVVGNDARFTWEDGYRDILRSENGKQTFLILGKATSWDSPIQFRLQAVRIPPKK